MLWISKFVWAIWDTQVSTVVFILILNIPEMFNYFSLFNYYFINLEFKNIQIKYVIHKTLVMNIFAGRIMDSNPSFTWEGFDNRSDDNIPSNVSHPVLTKDLSLCLPLAPNAKPLWLHFWYCLVGNSSKFDCVFCRLTCKFSNSLSSWIMISGTVIRTSSVWW